MLSTLGNRALLNVTLDHFLSTMPDEHRVRLNKYTANL